MRERFESILIKLFVRKIAACIINVWELYGNLTGLWYAGNFFPLNGSFRGLSFVEAIGNFIS